MRTPYPINPAALDVQALDVLHALARHKGQCLVVVIDPNREPATYLQFMGGIEAARHRNMMNDLTLDNGGEFLEAVAQ